MSIALSCKLRLVSVLCQYQDQDQDQASEAVGSVLADNLKILRGSLAANGPLNCPSRKHGLPFNPPPGCPWIVSILRGDHVLGDPGTTRGWVPGNLIFATVTYSLTYF